MARLHKNTASHRKRGENGGSSLYHPELDKLAHGYALLGMIDVEIADALEISKETFYNWRNKYPSFKEAVDLGKLPADAKVSEAYFNRCVGYDYFEEAVGKDGNVVSLRKHLPPNPSAAKHWLNNRQRKYWNGMQEINLSGEVSIVGLANRMRERELLIQKEDLDSSDEEE